MRQGETCDTKTEVSQRGSSFLDNTEFDVVHRMAKKCTKKLLITQVHSYCSGHLNLSFSGVAVAIAIMVFLNFLLFHILVAD